jgi:hypothetical protein
LPPDFDRWELAYKDGRTVAHVAAWRGHLPPNFDRWELADKDGRTVAQVAYESEHLPDDFPFYGLLKRQGNPRCVVGGSSTYISVNYFKENSEYQGMSDFQSANVFL